MDLCWGLTSDLQFVKNLRDRVLSDIYIRDLFQIFISAIYVRYISCQRFMLEIISETRHLCRSSACNFIQKDTTTQLT